MFSPCLRAGSPDTPASSHTKNTHLEDRRNVISKVTLRECESLS